MQDEAGGEGAARPDRGLVAAFAWCFLGVLLAFWVLPAATRLLRSEALPEPFPAVYPAGVDLRQMLAYTAVLPGGGSPYVGANLYPPLAVVLAHPLLALGTEGACVAVGGATLLAWAVLTFLLPLPGSQPGVGALALACGAGALLGPALPFELERGQWNAVATVAAVAGAALYRSRPRLALPAAALLTLGVQLKLYPAVFALLFRRPGEPAPRFAARLALLGAVNAALFFALGTDAFLDFLAAVRRQSESPFAWPGNHSIRSFVLESPGLYGWAGIAQAGLGIAVVASLLAALPDSRGSELLPPRLLLSCTLAALLLPSQSHDYKLVILAGPVARFAASLAGAQHEARSPLGPLVAAAAAAALAFASLPVACRPDALRNAAVPLFVLLGLSTLGGPLLRAPAGDGRRTP